MMQTIICYLNPFSVLSECSKTKILNEFIDQYIRHCNRTLVACHAFLLGMLSDNAILYCRTEGKVPTIILGHARDDHLRVALGPERAALQQGLAEVDAAGVHVQPRDHIVQGIDHHVQVGPGGVVEDILRVWGDAVLQRTHFERRVDVLCRGRRHCRLGAAGQSNITIR